MARPLVGTLLPEDYAEIVDGTGAAHAAASVFAENKLPVVVPHEHRFWEYGSAISAIVSVFNSRMADIEVLDIGSGPGILGPTLALNYDVNVTECEPDIGCWVARKPINEFLISRGRKPLHVLPIGFGSLPQRQYEAVTCISVIEHVEAEGRVWAELATRVKPGGVLFITTDCVPKGGKGYVYDELRTHNFTLNELEDRVNLLMSLGFSPMGTPDWNWNGCRVYDYTFWRGGFIKGGAKCE